MEPAVLIVLGMLAITDCHENKFLSDQVFEFAQERYTQKFDPTPEQKLKALKIFLSVPRPTQEHCSYFETELGKKMPHA